MANTPKSLDDIVPTAQGPATKIESGSDEEKKDQQTGYTNPNLHRRIVEGEDVSSDDKSFELSGYSGSSLSLSYKLGVHGTNSYRTTEYVVHDEDSTTSEIP